MSALERAVEFAGTQEKLAAAIGVSQGRISQWLKGEAIPAKYFPKIEAATGVTSYELLDDELRKLDCAGTSSRRSNSG